MEEQKVIELEYEFREPEEIETEEVIKNRKSTKGKITTERVKGKDGQYITGLQKKFRDGKHIGYDAVFCYGYKWAEDKKTGLPKKVQEKEKKSFSNKKDAELWLKEQALLKAKLAKKGKQLEKNGYTVADVCDLFHQKLVKDGEDEAYIHDHDLRMAHFKQYFVREDNKYVRKIDTAQIQEYLDWEATRERKNGKTGYCESSVMKYKSTLKMMWDFMLQDRNKYQVYENIVEVAQVKAKPSEFESVSLYYWEVEELIDDLCNIYDDPTYLFMLVMAYTQGMRRGELCGLKYGDINWDDKIITIKHNRVQRVKKSSGGKKNTDKDNVKLPKREKIRHIELHNIGFDMMRLYKEWQEEKLGRPVRDDEFILRFEINLKYDYIPSVGKISRKWSEMYQKVNKIRKKARKEEIRYARLHDGRETYATLALHGVKKKDGTIIAAADNRQVYESIGHELPEYMRNTTETVYNKYTTDRWDVTRFWNELLNINLYDTWQSHQQIRQMEEEMLSEFEREKLRIRKEKHMEKAKKERDAGNAPEEEFIIYDFNDEE
jgi:integrase